MAGNDGWDHHHEGRADDAGDRRGVADEIETQVVVDRCVDRVYGGGHQECVAVRGRTHQRVSCDVGGSARPVLDDELLAETLRSLTGFHAPTREAIGRQLGSHRGTQPAFPCELAWQGPGHPNW